jgi:hypothetical protein
VIDDAGKQLHDQCDVLLNGAGILKLVLMNLGKELSTNKFGK